MAVGDSQSGTLALNTVATETLEGTVHYVEVTNHEEGGEPIFVVAGAVAAAADLPDPAVDGTGQVVAPGATRRIAVKRSPTSSLTQVVVKLISDAAGSYTVSPAS